ncbi:hypothetical protein Saga11_12360 [Bacillus safensis]|nr:hypothetical protein Saga11_12360 [Bacillus safensis]
MDGRRGTGTDKKKAALRNRRSFKEWYTVWQTESSTYRRVLPSIWKVGEITATAAIEEAGMKRTTFYKLVEEIEAEEQGT